YLYDSKHDREYLDFSGFDSSRVLSFDHEGLKDASFTEQLARAAEYREPSGTLYTTRDAEFIERFAQGPLGEKFGHLFFAPSEAGAVDAAIKAAFSWKTRHNALHNRSEKARKILHFRQGFHGLTGYGLSATDSSDPRETADFPVFDWPRVSNPKLRFPLDDASLAEVAEAERQSVSEILLALDRDPGEVAAILIEPIQGRGGDNYFRSEFLAELRTICDQRDVLLIFDESETGFGSTGQWWDWLNHDVCPDLLVFGKKAQVCGVASTDRIDGVESVFSVPGRLGHSVFASPVDRVRASRVIEVVECDGLLENAQAMGGYLLKLILELAGVHSEIRNVRGRGLWTAFDLPSPGERDRMIDGCFVEQLLLLPGGTQTVRMRPTLDIDADSIARAVAQAEAGLKRGYGRT
ncbi:MAG: aminotransferase class III-fold pyridoxal phosphate-dependent enzyme, partial [Myxococcota bacterium]